MNSKLQVNGNLGHLAKVDVCCFAVNVFGLKTTWRCKSKPNLPFPVTATEIPLKPLNKKKSPKCQIKCYHSTFLTSVLMTVTTVYVIPFVVVFHTKCVHTVFIMKVIRLIVRPSCKVPLTEIRPSEVTLCGDVIQAQPGFFSILAVLYINVLLIVSDVNKNRVLLTTVGESYWPVDTFVTCEITESIEIAPPRVTDICGNAKIEQPAFNLYLLNRDTQPTKPTENVYHNRTRS